jgi:PPK2 family polyphosphate:nucleotide phosphotransferase
MGSGFRRFIEPYRVTRGSGFRLKDIDPGDTGGLTADKTEAREMLDEEKERLRELQEKLYAQDRWALLVVLQGMDAAGKDGTIKNVMSGLNPQGCQVTSFKTPSSEELDHDYLWRTMKALPERGRIGIFNRSHYEEVLVVRVHPELLLAQKIPSTVVGKHIWEERFGDIRAMESYLARNGIVPLKFFLHVSRAEQRKRILERLQDPEKNWKFSAADLAERKHWDNYQAAYQDLIGNTSTDEAPWFVVPADNKWFTRLVVAAAMIDALDGMNLAFPEVTPAQRQELAVFRAALEAEGGKRRKRS